jgi:hypothetical protein
LTLGMAHNTFCMHIANATSAEKTNFEHMYSLK